ncbi:MAG: toxin-activating lysine-acyltransferase [Hyphomicrobiales bacterium]|nr:toxin-activating lysine-acyltransferase [Hyphomicrobiales bacterium]
METQDKCANVGYALELLSLSPYHSQMEPREYIKFHILPPIWWSQIRIYVNTDGIPTALVTWAWLSQKTQADILATDRMLEPHEWNCGNLLFLNDWITPYGNARSVARDMMRKVFPGVSMASSIRRKLDGSVRRVNRWSKESTR